MAEKLKTEGNGKSLEEMSAHLAEKIEQMERDRVEREKADETRRKQREEFHRRLMERSQKKRAIFRSIEESQAVIAKLLAERKADYLSSSST